MAVLRELWCSGVGRMSWPYYGLDEMPRRALSKGGGSLGFELKIFGVGSEGYTYASNTTVTAVVRMPLGSSACGEMS